MIQKNIIIIDAIATGNELGYEFSKRGYTCIHVWSSIKRFESRFKTNVPYFFSQSLIFHKKIEKKIKNLNPIAIIPGSDSGLLPLKVLDKNYNLTHDRYFLTKSLNEPCSITTTKDLPQFDQFIIKPRFSLGEYYKIKKVNKHTNIPKNFFAQPFYQGQEYGVDIVCLNSKCKLISIYKYLKSSNLIKLMHDEAISVDGDDPIVKKIYQYINIVVKTANFTTGAAHIEIIDIKGCFKLIEANFRIQNGMDYQTTKLLCGRNQIEITADAYLNIDHHFNILDTYKHNGYLYQIHFVNTKKNKTAKEINWKEIYSSPSVTHVYQHFFDNDVLPCNKFTVEGTTAIIMMFNKNKNNLLNDVKLLKNILKKENL